jgi:hypothetical protein
MNTYEQVLQLRDGKTKPHLSQYAPVWLINEKFIPEDESVQFEAVFQHNIYGWVKRRYRYDSFNDVLYHKGQTLLNEDEALEIQLQAPYLTETVSDTPNAYGG